MRRIVVSLFALALAAALSLFVLGAILCAPALAPMGPAPDDIPAESVTLQTSVGQPVVGWLVRNSNGAGVVLLLHGVRANRTSMLSRARFLYRLGYSVLMIDLPGHGESTARHITFGYEESRGVVAALDYLGSEFPGERIGVIGVSLGAAAIVLADLSRPPDAVILESMYPTIEEATTNRVTMRLGSWARLLVPTLLWQLPLQTGVSANQLQPIAKIVDLGSPVLIVSGSADRHTTLAETRRLFEAAREPKEEWIVPGARHVDLHAFDTQAYESCIASFFGKWLRGDGLKLRVDRIKDERHDVQLSPE
jgi:uncharacterized protein